MLSTRSGAVVKGIRHIESKRVRLDSRRPAHPRREIGEADSRSNFAKALDGNCTSLEPQ